MKWTGAGRIECDFKIRQEEREEIFRRIFEAKGKWFIF